MSDRPLDDEDWRWEQRDHRLSQIEAFLFGAVVMLMIVGLVVTFT